jgi:hypothetical protein
MTGFERIGARAGVAAFSLALALCAGTASAEPTPTERITARARMADGRMLRSQGNLDGALKNFRAADSIMHAPTTGLEIARTLEAMGRLVEARTAIGRVLTIPVARNDPAPFQDAVAAASALYADLEQRIPTVTFVIQGMDPHASPKVWVDGQPVAQNELGAPLRLDPGTHQIAAQLGQIDAARSIELRERDKQPVVLKMPGAQDAIARPLQQGPSAWRTVGYVGFGTSAAGLVVGSIAGALALSTKHAAEADCIDNRCPPATWEAIDRARTYATVSTVGFVAFGTALGVGLTSLALGSGRDTTSSSVRVRSSVGFGYAQIEGTF